MLGFVLPVGDFFGISFETCLQFVRYMLLFYFSEGVELVQSLLGDGDHLLKDVPEDTFRAWNCGQGSLVCPSSVVVQERDELFQVERSLVLSSSLGF